MSKGPANLQDTIAPQVTVILPAYNSAKFLHSALESIVEQTLTDWELIVVDDHSHDASVEIAEGFAAGDPRIRVIALPENGGAAVSRNAGLEEARGAYIAFLDSDDRWHSDKLRRQLKWMKQEKSVFSCTGFERTTEGTDTKTLVNVPAQVSYKQLLAGNSIGCSTVMFHRQSLGHLRFPPLRMRQDFAMWLAFLKVVPTCHGLDVPLTLYRQHEGNLSTSLWDRITWNWKMYREAAGLARVQAAYFLTRHLVSAARRRRS